MDQPLLKSALALISGLLLLSCNFDDPNLEFDPARADSTLVSLSASQSFQVRRKNILESFGSFGCVSCPDAEAKLAPYFHQGPNYRPDLIVVNYHVKFGTTVKDYWVTDGTQARYDQSFANSLPQVSMNDSNGAFGIRKSDVNFNQGEYDSLVVRLRRLDTLTWIDLKLDTLNLIYDSIVQRMMVHFTVFNRGSIPEGALAFRALAVKNLPVLSPLTGTRPWEAVVVETTDKDSAGREMAMEGLPPLTAKTFSVALNIPADESPKHVKAPPLGMERPRDYAIIVFVKNGLGMVRNVLSYKYAPRSSN